MEINSTRCEFWFNIILNSSESKYYIKNGTMIILVVQNSETKERLNISKLGTDYICVIQVIKKIKLKNINLN